MCARFDAPVLSRGGGTSLAGQTTNTAVVVDWTKYCDALVSVDPGARSCVVEPGIVLDELDRRLAEALAIGLDGNLPGRHSESLGRRPGRPSGAARWAATAGATALTAGLVTAAGRAVHRRRRRH